MPLHACADCSREISTSAETCPGCGAVYRPRTVILRRTIDAGFGLGLGLAAWAFILAGIGAAVAFVLGALSLMG